MGLLLYGSIAIVALYRRQGERLAPRASTDTTRGIGGGWPRSERGCLRGSIKASAMAAAYPARPYADLMQT